MQTNNDQTTAAAAIQRLRLTFSKGGATRFIGHLDLARTLERSLNRAGIPVAYSQGFNRRPRLSLAAPLPLGYTSAAELADIWLTERMAPAQVHERLMARIAPGIIISQVEEVALGEPSLQQSIAASAYEVTFLDALEDELLVERVTALLNRDSLVRVRQGGKKGKEKPYDLRPLILALRVRQREGNTPQLIICLRQNPTQTGRPDELLLALGFDPLDTIVHRTRIYLVHEMEGLVSGSQ
jgi:radical SAM-linked protein